MQLRKKEEIKLFAYVNHDSFLHRLNPMVKLFVILAITMIISLSFYPLLPIGTFILSVVLICIGGKFPLMEILKRIRVFIGVACSFVFFMLILRGIDNPDAVYHLWKLGWTKQDFVHVLSLGTRIVAIVSMSMGFVLTTSPNDLVLSLILQLKVPCVHGYAALAAYRFLPSLQKEVRSIKLAQEIRGVEWEKGIINRIKSPFRIMLPLLCNAARRGERIAMAMDSRGLGRYKERTFLRKTKISHEDILFLASTIIIYTIVVLLLIQSGKFHYSIGFTN